jgi:tRNA G18 (ribose-2'-O)-methylase SpoU
MSPSSDIKILSADQFMRLNEAMAIRYLVDLAWSIEGHWNRPETRLQQIEYFRQCLADLGHSRHTSLRQLAKLAPKVTETMSLKHFLGIVLPIERQHTRGIRDEDFCIKEGDEPQAQQERIPLTLVLDNIRSAFNVGSIFRTAECLGVEKIYLCGYTPTPDDLKTKKTAMGCDSYMPWQWQQRTSDVLSRLGSEGITVIGVETVAAAPYHYSFDFPKPCALLFGNERHGLDAAVLSQTRHMIRIPVFGVKNSLNIGVALGICGYEVRRQWSGR